MPVHNSPKSMIALSLKEILVSVDSMLKYKKEKKVWEHTGCLGYPATILLLSVVDAMGTHICKGSVENHFNILKDRKYFSDFEFHTKDVKAIYKGFRCKLVHNSLMYVNFTLDIKSPNGTPIIWNDDKPTLYLVDFNNLVKKAADKFLKQLPKIKLNEKILKEIESSVT